MLLWGKCASLNSAAAKGALSCTADWNSQGRDLAALGCGSRPAMTTLLLLEFFESNLKLLLFPVPVDGEFDFGADFELSQGAGETSFFTNVCVAHFCDDVFNLQASFFGWTVFDDW